MTPNELGKVIARLRKQGKDDAHYEAKACKKALSKDVWDSVSAFGNTSGGTLLLGINEEDGFSLAKPFPLEKVLDQFVEGMGDGGNKGRKVDNPPQYSVSRMDFENGQILVIDIDEVENRFKPCYVSSKGITNGSYKRVDDKDIKLSATELYELQHMLEPSEADRGAVEGATLNDLDGSLVKALIDSEKERDSKAVRGTTSQQDALRRLSALTPQGEVALAGLLSLGFYPQQFYPKLVVDIAVHPGIEKSDPYEPRFLDRVICEGTTAEMVDSALQAIAKNLRTFSYIEGSGRRDELEVPLEVLREAIANALVHREYDRQFIGQSVSVDIYADRIEIVNPGGLWGGKTVDNLADGQSRCRNPTLMKLVSRIQSPRDGSPVEGQGSGIPLMYRLMRSKALDEPHFDVGVDYFKVVLQRGGAELVKNKEWLKTFSDRDTTRKEDAVLLELRRAKSVSTQQLHEHLAYDSDDIRQICARLVADGLVAEGPKDTFAVADLDSMGAEAERMPARDAILNVLAKASDPIGIREIAELTQRKISTLRAQMAALVSDGLVAPTAPTTNRSRKYVLAENGREFLEGK